MLDPLQDAVVEVRQATTADITLIERVGVAAVIMRLVKI